jgi:hypothetical protein
LVTWARVILIDRCEQILDIYCDCVYMTCLGGV